MSGISQLIELSSNEIEKVNGGTIVSFSFTAPNGVTYVDVVKVTRTYWEMADGSREYFADAAVPINPNGGSNFDSGAMVMALQGAGMPVFNVTHSWPY